MVAKKCSFCLLGASKAVRRRPRGYLSVDLRSLKFNARGKECRVAQVHRFGEAAGQYPAALRALQNCTAQ